MIAITRFSMSVTESPESGLPAPPLADSTGPSTRRGFVQHLDRRVEPLFDLLEHQIAWAGAAHSPFSNHSLGVPAKHASDAPFRERAAGIQPDKPAEQGCPLVGIC